MSLRNGPRLMSSLLLLAALGFFAYALIAFFAPVSLPGEAAPGAPELARAASNPNGAHALERYAGVSRGSMFFRAPVAPVASPPAESRLVVRAIFPGERATAVLAPAGEPPEGRSFVAGVGDVVEGERIVRITSDAVVVEIQGQHVTLRIP